jgi:hypothetical protein
MHVNIVLTFGELVWAFVGTAWAISALVTDCINPTEATMTDAPIIAVFVVILLTWIGLFFKVLLSCFSFNSISCHRGKRTEDKRVAAAAARDGSGGDSASSGVCARLFSCCMKKGNIELFQEVAQLLTDVFDDDDFVPTDIAAGLLLIYAKHSEVDEVAEVVVESKNAPIICWSGQNEGGWMALETVKHFSHYAGAAYGYTWFFMRNSKSSLVNLFGLRKHLLCCGCCCSCFNGDRGHVEADNCIGCNTAALKATLPHLDDESIVHISFKNRNDIRQIVMPTYLSSLP